MLIAYFIHDNSRFTDCYLFLAELATAFCTEKEEIEKINKMKLAPISKEHKDLMNKHFAPYKITDISTNYREFILLNEKLLPQAVEYNAEYTNEILQVQASANMTLNLALTATALSYR